MKASDCSKKRDRSAIMESEKAAAYGATTMPSKEKDRFFKWNESAAEAGATTVPRGKGGKPTNVDASEALSDITDVSGDWSSSGDETRRSLRLQEELLEAALDDPSKDTDLACVKKERREYRECHRAGAQPKSVAHRFGAQAKGLPAKPHQD